MIPGETYDLIQGCGSGPAGGTVAVAPELCAGLDQEKTRLNETLRLTIHSASEAQQHWYANRSPAADGEAPSAVLGKVGTVSRIDCRSVESQAGSETDHPGPRSYLQLDPFHE